LALLGTAIINVQNLYLEHIHKKLQICQFKEKLTVGILQAHVQAASNKTISSRQHHELRETEEMYSKTERSTDTSWAVTKILPKLMVHCMQTAS